MKPLPFHVKRENGVVFIDSVVDAAFRKALMDGVPPSLRGKMREALAAMPDKGARGHSIRYFGDELRAINDRIAPLLQELNKMLTETYRLPGIYDWLNETNFGNDYRMIKVFAAWADMMFSPPAIIRP